MNAQWAVALGILCCSVALGILCCSVGWIIYAIGRRVTSIRKRARYYQEQEVEKRAMIAARQKAMTLAVRLGTFYQQHAETQKFARQDNAPLRFPEDTFDLPRGYALYTFASNDFRSVHCPSIPQEEWGEDDRIKGILWNTHKYGIFDPSYSPWREPAVLEFLCDVEEDKFSRIIAEEEKAREAETERMREITRIKALEKDRLNQMRLKIVGEALSEARLKAGKSEAKMTLLHPSNTPLLHVDAVEVSHSQAVTTGGTG